MYNEKINLLVIIFIVIIYLLCALDHYQVITNSYFSWFIHEQMLTNEENSFFELLSAVAWFFSIILFFLLSKKSVGKIGFGMTTRWFIFFLMLSVVAFGEEISWGSYLFDYSKELNIIQMNAQKEANIHNIDLSNYLGIKEGDYLYYYASNLGHILTPVFYLVLTFFWVVLPLLKNRLSEYAIFREMPVPSMNFILFFVVHACVFIIIDIVFFNVGQVFEMFISLSAVMVALNMLESFDMRKV